MKLCAKGLHDIDKPGNLVKNGKRKDGVSIAWTCSPCKSGRNTEWNRVNRVHSEKTVCDYGHIFTLANTHWRTDKEGNITSRACRPCMGEKSAAHRAGVKRAKASDQRIAELEAIAAAMPPGELATWETKSIQEERSLPWEEVVWMEESACRNRDPELFFTQGWESQEAAEVRAAKAKSICRGCLVMDQCLDYALARRISHGIWGGLDRPERVEMARLRKRVAA